MEAMTYTIFPADAATTLLTGLFSVISANVGVVISVLGVTMGISFIIARFGRASRGGL